MLPLFCGSKGLSTNRFLRLTVILLISAVLLQTLFPGTPIAKNRKSLNSCTLVLVPLCFRAGYSTYSANESQFDFMYRTEGIKKQFGVGLNMKTEWESMLGSGR